MLMDYFVCLVYASQSLSGRRAGMDARRKCEKPSLGWVLCSGRYSSMTSTVTVLLQV